MGLEAVMVCIDTSEHMRNGDFAPTRHESQQDAANLIVGAKMQQNPENSVGVLCMASVGKVAGAKVLVSPTDDMGKILSSLHDAPVRGRVNFVESVQVAQLALKHRRNKNGSQRIILFVGSPLDADEASLVKAGKQLKKNNIAVDIILLGSDGDNAAKLRAFVDAVNSNDNSNLVQIPAGVVPSDALVSSRVIQSDAAADQGGGDGFPPAPREEFGGVDANLDPELAMALRVSMEEERARQEAVTAAAGGDPAAAPDAAPADAAPPVVATPRAAPAPVADDDGPDASMLEDDDALLQQALAMSMAESVAAAAAAAGAPAAAAEEDEDDGMEVDDDEAMQLALQMSMQAEADAAPAVQAPAFHDPSFVQQMLQELPGVDINDPQIQAALARIRGDEAAPAPAPDKPTE